MCLTEAPTGIGELFGLKAPVPQRHQAVTPGGQAPPRRDDKNCSRRAVGNVGAGPSRRPRPSITACALNGLIIESVRNA
jgi:hypothetical protein